MAFVQNFTIAQTLGNAGIVNLTDTSTGSDAAVVGRKAYLITNASTYLVPDGTTTSYITWLIGNSTIAINALKKDMSLNVKVDWTDAGGLMLYTKTILVNFQMYNSDFNYQLVNQEANGLASLNSINWLISRMKLYVALRDATVSVTDMSSITNGQGANDRGTYLRENKNLFY